MNTTPTRAAVHAAVEVVMLEPTATTVAQAVDQITDAVMATLTTLPEPVDLQPSFSLMLRGRTGTYTIGGQVTADVFSDLDLVERAVFAALTDHVRTLLLRGTNSYPVPSGVSDE